jgi:uncharacterized protein (TIGR02594 family)
MNKLLKAIYHSEKQVAEFIAEDGRHLLRSGGTLPWRVFNSGDLVSPVNSHGEPNPKHTKNYIGFAHGSKSGNSFFIFPDYETGRAELKASLLRKYINFSIEDTIKKYAPAHQNDTDKYIGDVSKLSGVSKDTKIKELNETQLNNVMDAIERVEGYHNEVETRKETWVSVSHIQATDGKSPIAGEEIVVKSKGKDKTLKSNDVGYFPPIVHTEHTEVFHKTADADLIKIGDLPADKGQHFSLLTKVAEFFSPNAPVKPPENPIKLKHPQHYTVQPGDNLSKIAARFKISVVQLKQDNHLLKNTIMPGQVLGIHTAAPVHIAQTQPKKALPKVKKEHKKHKKESTEHTETLPARSKEGEGEPLALTPPEEGVAPWMKHAVAEAKRWKGEKEGAIEKDINYHREVKDGQSAMSATSKVVTGKDGKKHTIVDNHSWCAAFANWCLMKAHYPIEFGQHAGRAQAFYMHVDKTTVNPLYVEIDEPIYGAIAQVLGKNGLAHHVGFVYARCDYDDNYMIILGGNQGDSIKFSPFQIEKSKNNNDHLRYFVPLAYAEQAKKDAKKGVEVGNLNALNELIGIKSKKKSSAKPTAEGTT